MRNMPEPRRRVELRLCSHLGVVHVRLVERVDAEPDAGDGRRELPAEELRAEIAAAGVESEHRMAGGFELGR